MNVITPFCPIRSFFIVPLEQFTYQYYKSIIGSRKLPLAFVDLDLLDRNIDIIKDRTGNIPVRVASKSVRCTYLLQYILDSGPPFKGIMSFTGSEAVFLSRHGFDDFLVAYPVVNRQEIQQICTELKQGKYINLMIDRPEHIKMLEEEGSRQEVVIPVTIDIDLSVDFPGLHFGVWRSSVRNMGDLKNLLKKISDAKNIRLEGVMGYEAQIAGVADKVPGQGGLNFVKSLLKRISLKKIAARRKQAVEEIRKMGFELRFVNGGGTGSVESTVSEPVITEVTVGSGFYNPHLFDYYHNFSMYPAAGFALAINRIPKEGTYTCSGGGYIASGATEKVKAPVPWLPKGARLDDNEGAGEVQTPVYYKGPEQLRVGDPVLFRHGKAGELCERFNTLLLIKQGQVINEVPTYRGEGKCFL